MKVAITGASGKTGYRIAEEARINSFDIRLLLRSTSEVPQSLNTVEKAIFSLSDVNSLDKALSGCDSLIIATGAKPSIDLTGPARIDAFGVQKQIESAKRVGVKRLILVSSLCSGRWIHPLNLFGLILIWKRIGERSHEASKLDWTVIRPGGLNEIEDNLDNEFIRFTGPDVQKDAYIPRRLVARCCIEALKTPSSIGQIIEVTSSPDVKPVSMQQALLALQ